MYFGHIESGAGQEGSQNPNPVGVEMGSYYLNRTRVEMHKPIFSSIQNAIITKPAPMDY